MELFIKRDDAESYILTRTDAVNEKCKVCYDAYWINFSVIKIEQINQQAHMCWYILKIIYILGNLCKEP